MFTTPAAKLMEDLNAVVRDAEALLKATANLTGEHIESARAGANATLREVKSRLSETQDELVQGATEAAEAAADYVKKNPWAALGIAAGVGVIVGLLLRRRD